MINDLRAESTEFGKQRILRRANKAWQEVFIRAFNEDSYGLKGWRHDFGKIGVPTPELFVLLDKLKNRELTGDAARDAVRKQTKDFGSLIHFILDKSLQCGVRATTVNKVFPGLIKKFKCQLAKDVPLEKLSFPRVAETKFDGVRVLILVNNGQAEFRTRNGKLLHLPIIQKQLEDIFKTSSFVLDTECTLANGTSDERTKVSGMLNSARQGRLIKEDLLVFNVFDLLTWDDWTTQKCTTPFLFRRADLDSGGICVNPALPFLTASPVNFVDSIEEMQRLFDYQLQNGFEGLILKDPNGHYEFKRSASWAKMKDVKTADLECVAIEEGRNKYNGMIGALICEGWVEGKHVLVNVGSGLSDAERAKEPYEYLNKIIEVKYNSLTQDKVTGQWSLFLPRFVTVRFDK